MRVLRQRALPHTLTYTAVLADEACALAVGAVVGMTIAIRNGQNVLWYRHLPGQFPYIAVCSPSLHALPPVQASWLLLH